LPSCNKTCKARPPSDSTPSVNFCKASMHFKLKPSNFDKKILHWCIDFLIQKLYHEICISQEFTVLNKHFLRPII
jgi:hypothetical protein